MPFATNISAQTWAEKEKHFTKSTNYQTPYAVRKGRESVQDCETSIYVITFMGQESHRRTRSTCPVLWSSPTHPPSDWWNSHAAPVWTVSHFFFSLEPEKWCDSCGPQIIFLYSSVYSSDRRRWFPVVLKELEKY